MHSNSGTPEVLPTVTQVPESLHSGKAEASELLLSVEIWSIATTVLAIGPEDFTVVQRRLASTSNASVLVGANCSFRVGRVGGGK